jgi:mRNA interferase MazF
MNKGKIVLVPFPFDDLSTTKVRPAVCLTEPMDVYGHIILAFITSRISANVLETDIVLEPTHVDFPATGLQKPSILKLNRLMTVKKTLIRRELGHLSPAFQLEIDQKLRQLFKLD